MEKTIKNMDLMLVEMKNSLEKGNIKSVKTLADTYLSQFKKVTGMSFGDKSIIKKCTDKFKVHKAVFKEIVSKCDSEMESSLISGKHKESHEIAITLERVDKAIKDINRYFPAPKINIKKKFPVSQHTQDLLEMSIKTGTLVSIYDERHQGAGKTVALIKKAHELDAVLVVGEKTHEDYARLLSKEMDLPITVISANGRHMFMAQNHKKMDINGYLVDETTDSENLKKFKNYRLLGGFNRIIIK